MLSNLQLYNIYDLFILKNNQNITLGTNVYIIITKYLINKYKYKYFYSFILFII